MSYSGITEKNDHPLQERWSHMLAVCDVFHLPGPKKAGMAASLLEPDNTIRSPDAMSTIGAANVKL